MTEFEQQRREIALRVLPTIYAEYWDGYVRKDGGLVCAKWQIGLCLDAFRLAEAFLDAEKIHKQRLAAAAAA